MTITGNNNNDDTIYFKEHLYLPGILVDVIHLIVIKNT